MIKKNNTTLLDPSKVAEKGYIHFASFGRPHGLKGAFFLKTPDRRTVWNKYASVLIETNTGYEEKKVTKNYLSGNALVLELEGLNSRTEVEALYDKKIFVHKSEIKLNPNEILVNDIVNFLVVSGEKGAIGTVVAVVSYGAQENLEIKIPERNDTVLYPFLEKYIHNIDWEKKQIDVEYLGEFFEG